MAETWILKVPLLWDLNNKTPGVIIYFYSFIGRKNDYFTILFSYWFSITTIENAIFSNQKNRTCQPTPIFINQGSFRFLGRIYYSWEATWTWILPSIRWWEHEDTMEHEWNITKYEWNIGDLPSDNFWKQRICMNMSCSKCHCKNAIVTEDQFSCHGLPFFWQ